MVKYVQKKENKMKKNLALFTILLFATPLAKAAILKVQNRTNRSISVAIEGSWKNYINTKIINPGQWGTFVSAPLRAIDGPLKFAFTSDLEKNRYSFYETYSRKKSPKKALITFPMAHFDIRGVQIAMKRGQPIIRQSYPKMLWLIIEQPWKPFKKTEITKKTQIGKTMEW